MMRCFTRRGGLIACGMLLAVGLGAQDQVEPPKSALRSKIDRSQPYQAPDGPGLQVIYGTDDRIDVYQETNPTRVAQASATCALVATSDLNLQGDGSYTMDTFTWTRSGLPACDEEPFGDQPVAPFCTGFLVAPDIIATAGHCFDSGDFSSVRFVFGFQMADSQTAVTTFNAEQVYSGVEVLGRQQADADYAIVRLDRAVTAPGVHPLSVRREGGPALGQSLGVIGHPAGLPLKIAYGPTTTVRNNTPAGYFIANLDTYGGNSGSPVFNASTGVVEGILVRGATDYLFQGSCFVSNRLSDTEEGEDVTRAPIFAALIPRRGVLFEREVYACGATLHLTLRDDNATSGPIAIQLTTQSDQETVILLPVAPGEWQGQIDSQPEFATISNDGLIHAYDGGTITATYVDQDAGQGQNETLQTTALMDCRAPVISNVYLIHQGADRFTVSFTTNEPAEVRLEAGLECGSLPLAVSGSDLATTHALTLTGLETCRLYYFNVVATDRAGTAARWDNSGFCGLAQTGQEILLLEDTFDAPSPIAWSHAAEIGPDDWTTGTLFAQSPPYAYGVTGADELIDSSLVTPLLPGGGQLRFRHGYDLEDGFDGAVLEVSTDGGSSWFDLGDQILSGGYDATISDSYDSAIGGRMAWTGIEDASEVNVDLSSTAGETIRVRFCFAADDSVQSEGWAIDDVRYFQAQPCEAVDPVRVIAPNGGEKITSGAPTAINWRTDLATAGSGVRFELWRKGSPVEHLGYGWNPSGLGRTVVHLPLVTTGEGYTVRVISTWDGTLLDESDAPFTILGREPENAIRPGGWELYR